MKPLVGMIAHDAVPAPLLGLFSDLCARADLVAYERGATAPLRAVVVGSPALLSLAPAGVAIAVWIDTADEIDELAGNDAVRAILASDRDLVDRSGGKGVEVPAAPIALPGVRPVAPAVRGARSSRARASGARESRSSTTRDRARGADGRSSMPRSTPRSRARLPSSCAGSSRYARWRGARPS